MRPICALCFKTVRYRVNNAPNGRVFMDSASKLQVVVEQWGWGGGGSIGERLSRLGRFLLSSSVRAAQHIAERGGPSH